MRKYLVVYSYDGDFNNTNHAIVEAENYDTAEKNIKKVFKEFVEMTPEEVDNIVDDIKTYYITPLNEEEVYTIRDEETK